MIRSAFTASAAATVAVAAAGCGGGDDPKTDPAAGGTQATTTAATAPPPKERKAASKQGAELKVVSSEFGRVVADRRGEALYLFDKEKDGSSECYDDCAEAWPPMLTKGDPVAADGAQQKLLGTTRRRDGKLQVTYRGHPLYYYVSDEPGRILCQNVDEYGGLWLVVKPDGDPVT